MTRRVLNASSFVSAATNRPPLWLTGRPLAVSPCARGPQHLRHGQYAVTSIHITRALPAAAGAGAGAASVRYFSSFDASDAATDVTSGTNGSGFASCSSSPASFGVWYAASSTT